MSKPIVIAVDVMGGDDAPSMTLEGVKIAQKKLKNVRFMLFGDQLVIEPFLDQNSYLKKHCTLVHAPDRVMPDDKPAVALRGRRESSMRYALNAVEEGLADAAVSAGNTGAYMAMSKFVLKSLVGIDRPAITAALPTLRGQSVMLDLGANVECNAENLLQFAIMGTVYAECVYKIRKPSIGLLNIGSEELKGGAVLQEAAEKIRNHPALERFHGFVEGDDIAKGTTDVIVTDGFTGNVTLKTIEGTAKLVTTLLKEALMHNWLSKLGTFLARGPLGRFKDRLDPRYHNGAILLGLRGIAVKSHGGTDAYGFSRALGVAYNLVHARAIDMIRERLEAHQEKVDAAN